MEMELGGQGWMDGWVEVGAAWGMSPSEVLQKMLEVGEEGARSHPNAD